MLLSIALCFAAGTSVRASEPLCAGGGEPHLVITTNQGAIVARLIEQAAPRAVRRLVRLAAGPVFAPELFAGQDKTPAVGYYDGLSFVYAQPHVEIGTGIRPPGELVEIETEIDAAALGLGQQLVEDAGKAMDVAQHELAPAYKRTVKSGKVHPRLKEWMDRLYESHDAAFLVGISQQQINEALGYVYQEGLASLPVTRGALMLRPLSPRVSSARLHIALVDLPQRTGRWMVVGHVVEGLENAQAISVGPLADPGVTRSRHRPLNPVPIESIRLDCRTSS